MKHLFTMALLISAVMASAATEFSTRVYKIKDFTKLDVSNVVKIVYTQSETYSVKLTGRRDWLDDMEVKNTGGTLTVKANNTKHFKNVKKNDQPDGHHNFILHLMAPQLKGIRLSGVSTFETKHLSVDGLFVSVSGVSKINVADIETGTFKAKISGVSTVNVNKLKCKDIEAKVSGASKVNMKQIIANKAEINISGASKAYLKQLNKSEEAIVNVSGASKIVLDAESSGELQMKLSGASKGELTFKGGKLHTSCTGASKLEADVNCASIEANCDGASKTRFRGTSDNVEIDGGGVATNIDTSQLNKY